jgi:peroxiredoxin
MALKKYGFCSFLFHYFLSSVYVILKWTITPLLYVGVKLSLRNKVALVVDEYLNRTFLPLTEKSGNEWRRDIVPDLKNGTKLLEYALEGNDGKLLSIRDLINGHWTAVLFIRGAWCSYSRLHMSEIQDHYQEFNEADIQVFAITYRTHVHWWQKDGIEIPVYCDKEGQLFKILGIQQHSWTDRSWGRIVPCEGVLLFEPDGKVLDFDLRVISGIKTAQEFLGAKSILSRFSEVKSRDA